MKVNQFSDSQRRLQSIVHSKDTVIIDAANKTKDVENGFYRNSVTGTVVEVVGVATPQSRGNDKMVIMKSVTGDFKYEPLLEFKKLIEVNRSWVGRFQRLERTV